MLHHSALGRLALVAAALSLVSMPALARIPTVVPEPTTLSIVGAALAGLVAFYRTRRDD
ncbi:MAG: PEP-CTERM sorting domain-containing protein [Alphaproteobacteria bacterium]|nr:PEP-CTERM sorting domain-containing protein [Alphaproteobacteria bacterium]